MAAKKTTAAPTFKEKARYRFDTTLAWGTGIVMLWLGIIVLFLVVLTGVTLALSGVANSDDSNVGLLEGIWQGLLRAMDAGTMGGDEGWGFRAVSLVITVAGIFILSALIGLISSAIDQKLEELRKGRTPVLESGHTLVLGWSSKLFPVLSELAIANANQKSSCVVVMAPRDKVEMEDEVRDRVGSLGSMRVVCRTGDPSDPGDLEIVRPESAKSVILLAGEEGDPDSEVVRTVLSLMAHGADLEHTKLVAEVPTRHTAEALRDVLGDRITTMVSSEVIGLITAQVCRQAGLGTVYQELLDFDGDEIYFQPEPRLVGCTFAEAVLAYDSSSVIGLRHRDGGVQINPPMATTIADGDMVIAVATDDDTIVLPPGFDAGRSALTRLDVITPESPQERILLVGWNDVAPMILRELDQSLAPGSVATALVDPTLVDPGDVVANLDLAHIELNVLAHDSGPSRSLEQAVTTARPDHIVVLCYRSGLTTSQSDARALLTLLQLDQLFTQQPQLRNGATVVTELLDARDVPLAEATDVDDFIVSDKLNSLMLAQLAENPELAAVFSELFDSHGATVTLRPVSSYPVEGSGAFRRFVLAGCERGQLVFGYRRRTAAGVDTVVNPHKDTEVTLAPTDELVILTSGAATRSGGHGGAADAAGAVA